MPNGEPTVAEAPKAGGATLEQKLSIFDSIGKSLEDLVKAVGSIPSLIKDTVYYTYYTAKAGLGLAAGVAIAGAYHAFIYSATSGLSLTATIANLIKYGYHALILPIGMAIGTWLANLKNKTKTTFKQMANEIAIGGILGGLLHHIFLGSRYLIDVVKSTYGTAAGLLTGAGCAVAQMPPFLAANELLNRTLISDYKPKPLKDMFKQIKGPMKWLIPPLIANFTVVPEYLGHSYQMPTAAGISLAYGLLKAEPKKKEEKPETYKLPQPYALPKAA